MDDFKKEKDIFKKAEIVFNLLKDRNFRLVDLSKKLGVTSSYLCHLLRLKKIPDIRELARNSKRNLNLDLLVGEGFVPKHGVSVPQEFDYFFVRIG